MKRSEEVVAGTRETADAYRPPYLAAVIASLLVWALYALTLGPTTAFWDTSEYIATAHILGIPHPPGNPLFVVLARVWSLLLAPSGLSVAVRVNLFAAATSAIASGFFFLVAHRIIRSFAPTRWAAPAGASASALLCGTAFTVWNQSTVNEKVYTLSVMIGAAVSWLALLWHDRRQEPASARYLLLALYLIVLGSTNHLMSVLPAPALAVFVLYAASLGFWMIAAKSVEFYYHYFLPSCFLMAALALALDEFWKRKARVVPIAALAISVALFAWFYPILSAAPLDGPQAFAKWMWYDGWR